MGDDWRRIFSVLYAVRLRLLDSFHIPANNREPRLSRLFRNINGDQDNCYPFRSGMTPKDFEVSEQNQIMSGLPTLTVAVLLGHR
jgi:hypothetical protein